MKHKVFLNGVNLYDGELEVESLACWALAIRVIGVTSANAHIVRYTGGDVAREEHYRFGMVMGENTLSMSVGDGVTTKDRVN